MKEKIIIPNNKYNNDYKNNIAKGKKYNYYKNEIIVNGKKHYVNEPITIIKTNRKARVLKYVKKTNEIIYYIKELRTFTYGITTIDKIIFEENETKLVNFDKEERNHLIAISLLL